MFYIPLCREDKQLPAPPPKPAKKPIPPPKKPSHDAADDQVDGGASKPLKLGTLSTVHIY